MPEERACSSQGTLPVTPLPCRQTGAPVSAGRLPSCPLPRRGSGQVPVSAAGAAFLSRRNPSYSALGQAEQGAGSLLPWPVDGRGRSLPGVALPREELEELKPQGTLWSPETGPEPGAEDEEGQSGNPGPRPGDPQRRMQSAWMGVSKASS